jgi:hypothetical protein
VTNSGSDVLSGPGFGYEIFNSGSVPQNVRVSGVSVSGCRFDGTNVGADESTVVENCVVRTVGGVGIWANTIRGCVALDCGSTAIQGRQVSESRGESVGGYGLYAANTAQNCYGTSSSGTGLYAEGTAIACYGDTTTGPRGLYARNAAFCVGSRPSGTAIEATIANGCWAEFGTLLITFKYNMPLAKNLQPETCNLKPSTRIGL